ncbi:hypothetical protein PM082_018459 [Marasmius tenuissimus]|nr:hypothetical protein PM082_018459 [Marasmius tenuissimus]
MSRNSSNPSPALIQAISKSRAWMESVTFSRDHDGTFIMNAFLRYRSAANAIRALRNLGKPPASLDISHPSPTITSFLEICAIIIAEFAEPSRTRSALYLVKSNWSLIEPWTTFLLEQVVLTDEIPTTTEGNELLEYCITLLPTLINYPDLCRRPDIDTFDEMGALIDADPSLRGRIIRVWLKILYSDDPHPSWRRWSVLFLTGLQGCTTESLSISDEVLTQLHVDGRNPDLASRFVRILNSVLPNVSSMGEAELGYLSMFSHSIGQCLGVHSKLMLLLPLDSRRLLTVSVTKLLAGVLYKNKRIRRNSDTNDQALIEAHGIVTAGLMTLRCLFMVDETLIVDAIESGLVVAMLKAAPCYHAYAVEKERQNPKYSLGFRDTFSSISEFLIYPPVLRAFVRSLRKVDDAVLDGDGYTGEKPSWWPYWDNCRKVGMMLQGMRQRTKQVPSLLCANDKCPCISGHRRLLCLGCKNETYCSRECRTVHWNAKHKDTCSSLQEQNRAIRPVSTLDRQYYREIIEAYASTHSTHFTVAFHDFVQSPPNPSNLKSSIVLRDFSFDPSDLLSVEPYTLTDLDSVLDDWISNKEEKGRLRDLIDVLDLEGGYVFVGRFPRLKNVVIQIVRFREEEEEDPYTSVD